jgi:urease beta subunit
VELLTAVQFTPSEEYAIYAIAYGGGKFVAGGANGKISVFDNSNVND